MTGTLELPPVCRRRRWPPLALAVLSMAVLAYVTAGWVAGVVA